MLPEKLTKREWFAGEAMKALLMQHNENSEYVLSLYTYNTKTIMQNLKELSYKIADEMLS